MEMLEQFSFFSDPLNRPVPNELLILFQFHEFLKTQIRHPFIISREPVFIISE